MAEPAKEIKRDDRRSTRNNSAVMSYMARKTTFEGGEGMVILIRFRCCRELNKIGLVWTLALLLIIWWFFGLSVVCITNHFIA